MRIGRKYPVPGTADDALFPFLCVFPSIMAIDGSRIIWLQPIESSSSFLLSLSRSIHNCLSRFLLLWWTDYFFLLCQTVIVIVLSLTILINLIFILDANYKSRTSPTTNHLVSAGKTYLKLIYSFFLIYFLSFDFVDEGVQESNNRSDAVYLSLDIVSSRSRVSVSVDGAEVKTIFELFSVQLLPSINGWRLFSFALLTIRWWRITKKVKVVVFTYWSWIKERAPLWLASSLTLIHRTRMKR